MIRINLLPWREQQRKQRQKDYISHLVAVSLLAIGVIAGTHIVLDSKIDGQRARNNLLQTEIKKVDERLAEIKTLEQTKKALVDRMEVIQQLQESRPEVVHLFDDIVSTMPEGMFLTRVQQKGNALSIDGKTESNARVSTYMRNLEASEWLKDARLLYIEAKDDNKKTNNNASSSIRSFALQVTQESPNQEATK